MNGELFLEKSSHERKPTSFRSSKTHMQIAKEMIMRKYGLSGNWSPYKNHVNPKSAGLARSLSDSATCVPDRKNKLNKYQEAFDLSKSSDSLTLKTDVIEHNIDKDLCPVDAVSMKNTIKTRTALGRSFSTGKILSKKPVDFGYRVLQKYRKKWRSVDIYERRWKAKRNGDACFVARDINCSLNHLEVSRGNKMNRNKLILDDQDDESENSEYGLGRGDGSPRFQARNEQTQTCINKFGSVHVDFLLQHKGIGDTVKDSKYRVYSKGDNCIDDSGVDLFDVSSHQRSNGNSFHHRSSVVSTDYGGDDSIFYSDVPMIDTNYGSDTEDYECKFVKNKTESSDSSQMQTAASGALPHKCGHSEVVEEDDFSVLDDLENAITLPVRQAEKTKSAPVDLFQMQFLSFLSSKKQTAKRRKKSAKQEENIHEGDSLVRQEENMLEGDSLVRQEKSIFDEDSLVRQEEGILEGNSGDDPTWKLDEEKEEEVSHSYSQHQTRGRRSKQGRKSCCPCCLGSPQRRQSHHSGEEGKERKYRLPRNYKQFIAKTVKLLEIREKIQQLLLVLFPECSDIVTELRPRLEKIDSLLDDINAGILCEDDKEEGLEDMPPTLTREEPQVVRQESNDKPCSELDLEVTGVPLDKMFQSNQSDLSGIKLSKPGGDTLHSSPSTEIPDRCECSLTRTSRGGNCPTGDTNPVPCNSLNCQIEISNTSQITVASFDSPVVHSTSSKNSSYKCQTSPLSSAAAAASAASFGEGLDNSLIADSDAQHSQPCLTTTAEREKSGPVSGLSLSDKELALVSSDRDIGGKLLESPAEVTGLCNSDSPKDVEGTDQIQKELEAKIEVIDLCTPEKCPKVVQRSDRVENVSEQKEEVPSTCDRCHKRIFFDVESSDSKASEVCDKTHVINVDLDVPRVVLCKNPDKCLLKLQRKFSSLISNLFPGAGFRSSFFKNLNNLELLIDVLLESCNISKKQTGENQTEVDHMDWSCDEISVEPSSDGDKSRELGESASTDNAGSVKGCNPSGMEFSDRSSKGDMETDENNSVSSVVDRNENELNLGQDKNESELNLSHPLTNETSDSLEESTITEEGISDEEDIEEITLNTEEEEVVPEVESSTVSSSGVLELSYEEFLQECASNSAKKETKNQVESTEEHKETLDKKQKVSNKQDKVEKNLTCKDAHIDMDRREQDDGTRSLNAILQNGFTYDEEDCHSDQKPLQDICNSSSGRRRSSGDKNIFELFQQPSIS